MKRIISLFIILITTIVLFGCTKKDSLYKRKGDKIYFGTYPQSLVSYKKLIDKLNKKSGELPTSSNKYSWTDYNYYISGNVESFMFYQDIDLNNDGSYDYRGVYFTKYRPDDTDVESSKETSYQDENGYDINTVYYFKYEPIEWKILSEIDGKAFIISNMVLDSQDAYPIWYEGKYEHNGNEGYGNNYALSNVRKWLNDTFYNTSFNDLQKEIIEVTEVENDASSTDANAREYVCENTNDKIFLLSLKEMLLLESDNANRLVVGTDYAKAQGLLTDGTPYGYWRLRSPDSCGSMYIWTSMSDGITRGGNMRNTCFGTLPALWIKL